jgi:hypothetical protein
MSCLVVSSLIQPFSFQYAFNDPVLCWNSYSGCSPFIATNDPFAGCSETPPTPTHPPHCAVCPTLPCSLDSWPLRESLHSFPNLGNGPYPVTSRSRLHVAQAIQNGWAGSTVRCYAGSIKQFLRFCDVEGIPDHLRLPADKFVLCAFSASSFFLIFRIHSSHRLSLAYQVFKCQLNIPCFFFCP